MLLLLTHSVYDPDLKLYAQNMILKYVEVLCYSNAPMKDQCSVKWIDQ